MEVEAASASLDTTKELAIKGFNQILMDLQSARQFVIDQAPDVVQQIYIRELYSRGFLSALGLIILVVGLVTIYLSVKAGRKDNWNGDDPSIVFGIGAVFGVVGVVITLVNLYSLMQLIVAPKLFIVEHIMKVIKDGF